MAANGTRISAIHTSNTQVSACLQQQRHSVVVDFSLSPLFADRVRRQSPEAQLIIICS
jgi:hypothetical protein